MTLLLFKALTAPLLILCLTLLIRRFGAVIGGLALGVPLITGPISLFTALEQGRTFAAHAAVGNVVGQVSTCLFCFAYAQAARRLPAWASALSGVAAFFAAKALWNRVSWNFGSALALLVCAMALLGSLMPAGKSVAAASPPAWDLPLRMLLASAFVLGLTALTGHLGPQLSGLLAPFPTMVLILAVFTHLRQGGAAALAMLRGVVIGSGAFGVFFGLLAWALAHTHWPLGVLYPVALLASLSASGAAYLLNRMSAQRHAGVGPA